MAEDNILHLPPQDAGPELLIGPFTEYRVQVEGRIIPGLTGWAEGDLVWLCVDHRFAAPFPKEFAPNAAQLIAQALAIGNGYPWLGAENKDKPFAPIGCKVEGK